MVSFSDYELALTIDEQIKSKKYNSKFRTQDTYNVSNNVNVLNAPLAMEAILFPTRLLTNKQTNKQLKNIYVWSLNDCCPWNVRIGLPFM